MSGEKTVKELLLELVEEQKSFSEEAKELREELEKIDLEGLNAELVDIRRMLEEVVVKAAMESIKVDRRSGMKQIDLPLVQRIADTLGVGNEPD